MTPAERQAIQRAVDEYREDCRRSLPGGLSIGGLSGLSGPLEVEVTPDGISWIVEFRCAGRVLYSGCAEPQSSLANLYTNIVACVRFLRTGAQRADWSVS